MLCAVHANFEDAFDASPTAVGKDGRRYRDVAVRLHLTYPLCIPSLTTLTGRPMYVLWRDGAYGPSPLEDPVRVQVVRFPPRTVLIERYQDRDLASRVTHLTE
jgi:hypothetical protein